MSRRRKTARIVKSAVPEGMETPCEVVADQLEMLAREGAREMLMTTLADEVDAYLGRGRYERGGGFRGYRNGTSPRRLTLGSGTVALDTPRVRDIPPGQTPFESKIIRKYPRRSDTIDETFTNLFVEGLATRDFEPSLRLLMGEQAPLSPSTISRLTRRFKAQYEAFDQRDLSDHRFVYVWADGIYLKAGLGTEKACLLVLIGADMEGRKHLIALREGYRESAASWGERLRDCRARGLNEPACWVADGALGIWAAVNEHCPHSAQQRCTNHKTMNVIESPFASVRLRTNAAKRFKKTKSGVYLMHEVMKRLEPRWRRLKSAPLCATVPLPEKKAAKVA